MTSKPRRNFLKRAALALPIVAAADVAGEAVEQAKGVEQPESFWRDRMIDPDDGKKYGWFVDTRRCFGCPACEVSCKSENDVPLGNYIRQTNYRDVGKFPDVARVFLPMRCITKGIWGTVAIDYDTCCGHGSCVDACPYGAIYMDPVANQAVKCHNCYHRVESGMEPACVPTCPAEALHFGDLNDPDSKISTAMQRESWWTDHS